MVNMRANITAFWVLVLIVTCPMSASAKDFYTNAEVSALLFDHHFGLAERCAVRAQECKNAGIVHMWHYYIGAAQVSFRQAEVRRAEVGLLVKYGCCSSATADNYKQFVNLERLVRAISH
jgi:hypothetical protein